MVVDVRFPDGRQRLFWPEDLEEISSPRPWWRSLLLDGKRGVREMEELRFVKFDYHLDESDPDVVILRRQDDSFVAAFSATGPTKEGIVEVAKEDYRRLMEANADLLDLRGDGYRKRSAQTWSVLSHPSA